MQLEGTPTVWGSQQIKQLALALLGEMEIYEIFYILRRRIDMKQAEIAKQTNIQSVLLSMFERGNIILHDDDIEKLLKTYSSKIEEKKKMEAEKR